MKKNLRQASLILLVLALTSVLCLTMYVTDNKYRREGLQAADGLLVVEEGDLERWPVSYLVSGWAFYPDALLNPADFAGGNAESYLFYTSIGERTRFDNTGDKNDPHGSGSYFLRLELPKQVQTYALELPEVYFAYKLYIGGRLVLEMGDPEPESYTPRTQNRMVTFEAAGQTTILLAVSNYSHFYSGLVYPPAFGTPLGVNTMRGLRLGIALFVDTVALLSGALALYFGLRMKHRSALFFSLTCVVMCVFTSYSLVHSSFSLPIVPWYGIEVFAGYLLPLLVVVLYNRICGMGAYIKRISVGVTAAVSLLALCYSFSGPLLKVPVMETFSVLVMAFKGTFFVYLLAVAVYSLKSRREASPLFYASLVYGTAFVWDRLLPEFEPVVSGWFIEWGSIALVAGIGYTLWRDITTAYANHLAFAQERRLMARQLTMQTEYGRQIESRSQENHRLIHDFRQHLRAIGGIAARQGCTAEENNKELLHYIEQVAQSTRAAKPSLNGRFCENPAVNALLQYYSSLGDEGRIETSFQLMLPPGLPLSDVELCTLLGNLLENAVDACNRRGEGGFIHVSTRLTGNTFYLLVENSTDGGYHQIGGHFLSRKGGSPRFGVGLESVRNVVESAGGTLSIYPLENMFRVGIVLQTGEP